MSDNEAKGQRWDPERYARNARFVADLGAPLLELLDPKAGERILDLGCGDGPLTLKLMAVGAEVLGIDASLEQVEAARGNGVNAEVGDGMNLNFVASFNAVFSNAALHWMKQPEAVIDGVWSALKPGGRFVAEFGGKGNVQHIHKALIEALGRRGIDASAADPWYFPGTAEYGALLEARGFEVGSLQLIPRPTPLPSDMVGWLETFGESFIKQLPRAERVAFLEEVCGELKPLLYREGVWSADYVRLRFAAFKPPLAPQS